MVSYGAVLRSFRTQARLTQRELGDLAAVDFVLLSKIENKRVAPPDGDDDVHCRLAVALVERGPHPLDHLRAGDLEQRLRGPARKPFEPAPVHAGHVFLCGRRDPEAERAAWEQRLADWTEASRR